MAQVVVNGAMIKCALSVPAPPMPLTVIPKGPPVMAGSMPAATIMDNKPIVNIPPFGMCTSLANPTVAAATAAALGVLTPMPCVPATVAPWVVGAPTVLIGNMPALDNTSKLMCMWAGVIQVVTPGEFTVQIP